MRPRSLVVAAATIAVVMTVLAPGGAAVSQAPVVAANPTDQLAGSVRAAGNPVRGATVRLMVAGATPGTAIEVHSALTDRAGSFRVTIPASVGADAVLYATVTGGTSGKSLLGAEVELAASLADIRSGRVTINELTTVAAGYSLAQFALDGSLGGASPGLQNAAMMPRNLVDPRTGQLTRFFQTAPNGSSTEALATFNSLASIVAGCVTKANDCTVFLDAATDAWGVRPATTWQAMTLLPTSPSGDPAGIMAQVPEVRLYTPARTEPPAGWYLALKFWGNGRQFNGPGNLAFDSRGRVWANTNATWSNNPRKVCPGTEIFLLDPYAPGQPVTSYSGGGLDGSGFGIALDPQERVWATNFGFTGLFCPTPPTSNSVSLFAPDGTALSPDDGFLEGPISWPQGVKSNADGDVWIANCGDDNLVVYPDGDPARAQTVGESMSLTFDLAHNSAGNIFVTANGASQVFGFDSAGLALPGSPFGDPSTIEKPLGIASDSLGNVWVSNSGVVDIPCAPGEELEVPAGDIRLRGSMARLAPDGTVTRFEGAGMTVPWGIAVDGDDTIWVANFFGERLSHLCGARIATCPTGQIGDEISPTQTGYFFDGLQRNTGVQIDASGNVWLTNNWKTVPEATNQYGDGLVVFLGAAAPIAMPLIGGTPRQP
jgi:sugar lactone lactonase YvrE